MQKNPYPGKFIVFEGLDGSGQSTQAALLRDFLLGQGKDVLLTKEPTQEGAAAKKIKEIVVEKNVVASPQELQQLFTQDRAEHLDTVIIPALKLGTWVISDRYFFSTFAYGASQGVDFELLIEQNQKFLLPDLTFLLKVSPAVCVERIQKRGKSITLFEEQEKLTKIWKVYETFPGRFENMHLINGEQLEENVHRDIIKCI
ncbi:MAG: dTMP kinase [Candidatus Wildermuthbacteria bacterium]|nr:dTMP kinase [Candidatus Wildermuthbacteria bacterium]